ncbi:MAG TPA: SDR family oxidoreductase [Acidimicrobiia bacterium]|nr:SDR family oxidoreductase [Acidimicrobiia bacterium]
MERVLEGKTAVVTGASSGIGRAIAERLGAAGAFVYLAGRTLDAMEESRAKIEDAGGKAEVVSTDVRDVSSVYSLVDRAVTDTGRLDVMVNNAGLSYPGPIADQTPEQWREMLEVNVLALLAGCQAAIRAMRSTGNGGHVVNISSIAAQHEDSGVYGATKHAVNCITSTLRKELENDDIRVVTVMPGAVATNFARNFDPEFIQGIGALVGIEMDWEQGSRLPDEVLTKAQDALKQLLAAPEDIADAVLYAVSPPLHVNVAEIVVRPARQIQL